MVAIYITGGIIKEEVAYEKQLRLSGEVQGRYISW